MAKSIVEKLNLQKYNRIAILNKPTGTDSLAELVDCDTTHEGAYDLIFAFVLDMNSLKKLVDDVIDHQHWQESRPREVN